MNRILQLIKHYRLSLLTGILVGTSFIPFPPWAVLFCYVPLWLDIVEERSLKTVFKKAWVSQFTLTLIGFYWIAYVANHFAKLPTPVAILATILFCSIVHLYIPIAFTLAQFITNKFHLKTPVRFLLYSFALILFEKIWPSMFPWHLGYTLYSLNLNSAQLAEYFGFIGLSGFLLLSNALVAIGWDLRTYARSTSSIIFMTTALMWIVFEFLGLQVKKHIRPADSELTVTIAQADIGNLEEAMQKYGRAYRERILQDFITLTDNEVRTHKSDLVVWPESALPIILEKEYLYRPVQQQLFNKLNEWQTTLVTGGYGEDSTKQSPPGGPMTYNGLFILQNNDIVGKYYKTERLVFGEYLPLGDQFPILYRWIQEAGYFGKGFGPAAMPVTFKNRNLHIGGQICYESLFAEFSRELNLKKNNFIVNVTNDYWYGPYSERFQHLYMTLSRSIETRTPVIRSTNTGISTVALASGKILEKSPYGGTWAHTYKVPYYSEVTPTFYSQYGHFLLLFFAFLHLFIALIFVTFRHEVAPLPLQESLR